MAEIPLKKISSDIFAPINGKNYFKEGKFYLKTITELFSRITIIKAVRKIDGFAVKNVYKHYWIPNLVYQIVCYQIKNYNIHRIF